MSERDITAIINHADEVSLQEKLKVVWKLSTPSILAQISEIMMEYIDAAMVGVLGATASASIGLVSSSTWLVGGIVLSLSNGFSVQVAHAVGAKDANRSSKIFKKCLLPSLVFSCVIGLLSFICGFYLPKWLGADASLYQEAKDYFTVFSLFLPARMMNYICLSMLRCTGNMKTPSILSTLMCIFDVIFNYFFIFPYTTISLFGLNLTIPGMNLGVLGAQLGTSLAVVVCMILAFIECKKSMYLKLKKEDSYLPEKKILKEALRIGGPMSIQQVTLSLAQVVSTRIVAPLGTIAIAANSFAVTAESICYMPGYGISSAATTMVGQAYGAKQKRSAKSFAWLSVITGMVVMGLMALLMYFISPMIFSFLTPIKEIQELGVNVLRIELLAEPLFGASIVCSGALCGAGDTFVPALLNLISIWGIRIPVSYVLCQKIGLYGAWIAMCIELCIRGILFLIRLSRGNWMKKIEASEV